MKKTFITSRSSTTTIEFSINNSDEIKKISIKDFFSFLLEELKNNPKTDFFFLSFKSFENIFKNVKNDFSEADYNKLRSTIYDFKLETLLGNANIRQFENLKELNIINQKFTEIKTLNELVFSQKFQKSVETYYSFFQQFKIKPTFSQSTNAQLIYQIFYQDKKEVQNKKEVFSFDENVFSSAFLKEVMQNIKTPSIKEFFLKMKRPLTFDEKNNKVVQEDLNFEL
ncbi:MAG: hypothetical protein ACRC4M_04030, partial [Mycoplasma sp.]